MKKKWYQAEYKGKIYNIFAFCVEEVYWKVLEKNRIYFSNEKCEEIVEKEKMVIN